MLLLSWNSEDTEKVWRAILPCDMLMLFKSDPKSKQSE